MVSNERLDLEVLLRGVVWMEKQRVLVVDDDREIVNAIAINLQNEGYKVLKAYNGLEALDIINSQTVHLIILDVMMPQMDGLSATLKIRDKRNIPIITSRLSLRTPTRSSDCPWAPTIMSPNRSTAWNSWPG